MAGSRGRPRSVLGLLSALPQGPPTGLALSLKAETLGRISLCLFCSQRDFWAQTLQGVGRSAPSRQWEGRGMVEALSLQTSEVTLGARAQAACAHSSWPGFQPKLLTQKHLESAFAAFPSLGVHPFLKVLRPATSRMECELHRFRDWGWGATEGI